MKEIRIIVVLLMASVMFSLSSCKTASIVNFESEKFEQFKTNSISIDEYPDTFYYAHVMTAVQVQLIFMKFSKENDFSETLFQNISMLDDKGIELYKKEQVSLSSNGIPHSENGCNYEIYSYQIEKSEFAPNILENHITEYIILAFEIDGKKYSEKLKRVEKKYLVTRT
ncbi:MAG: hypothetical protein K2J68_03890 [Treponemataceae bacterium]|nr:hypothetical protein [Treponemataceae bacterium]